MRGLNIPGYWLGAAINLFVLIAASAVPVPYPQLPPAVQKGIAAQLQGGKLGEVEREEEDGKVTYSFDVTRGSREISYTVDDQGALASIEVTLADVSLPIQKTIQAQIGQKGTLDSIDATFEEGKPSFEVSWKTKDGADHSFTVASDGKLLSIDFKLEETPPPVQATIKTEAGAGQIKDITEDFEDEPALFQVTVTRDGLERSFAVGTDGRLESRQVLLSELPKPVQATIQQNVGAAKVVEIDQLFEKEKGVFPYEVEAQKDGKRFRFQVGPKGKYLGPVE